MIADHAGVVAGRLVLETNDVAADHPDWCFPKVVAGADRLTALALGHPLLPVEH